MRAMRELLERTARSILSSSFRFFASETSERSVELLERATTVADEMATRTRPMAIRTAARMMPVRMLAMNCAETPLRARASRPPPGRT